MFYRGKSIEIRKAQRATDTIPTILIGGGDCARLLVNDPALSGRGAFRIKKVFSPSNHRREKKIGDFDVRPLSELPDYLKKKKIKAAVVATTSPDAKNVFSILNNSPVMIILNFSPIKADVNADIKVFDFNLKIKLDVISYYLHHFDIPVLPENVFL